MESKAVETDLFAHEIFHPILCHVCRVRLRPEIACIIGTPEFKRHQVIDFIAAGTSEPGSMRDPIRVVDFMLGLLRYVPMGLRVAAFADGRRSRGCAQARGAPVIG
jgi:hypothetical protein